MKDDKQHRDEHAEELDATAEHTDETAEDLDVAAEEAEDVKGGISLNYSKITYD